MEIVTYKCDICGATTKKPFSLFSSSVIMQASDLEIKAKSGGAAVHITTAMDFKIQSVYCASASLTLNIGDRNHYPYRDLHVCNKCAIKILKHVMSELEQKSETKE